MYSDKSKPCEILNVGEKEHFCQAIKHILGIDNAVSDQICSSCDMSFFLKHLLSIIAILISKNKLVDVNSVRKFIDDQYSELCVQEHILNLALLEDIGMSAHKLSLGIGLITQAEYDEIEADLLQQQAEVYQELITEVNTNE